MNLIQTVVDSTKKANAVRAAAIATVRAQSGDTAAEYVGLTVSFVATARTLDGIASNCLDGLTAPICNDLLAAMCDKFSIELSKRLGIAPADEIPLLKRALGIVDEMFACREEGAAASKSELASMAGAPVDKSMLN